MSSLYHRVRVSNIIEETPLAKTFVLEPMDGWQPGYKSGQFITLVFRTGSGEKRRSFSISSSQAVGEPMMITVKKMDNGEFSRRLIYHTRVNDVFETTGAAGFFVLKQEPFENYVFLAAGSGISPIYAIIKELLHSRTAHIILIYSNKSEEDCIFYSSLLQMQQAFAHKFSIRFLFSNRQQVLQSRLSHWLLTQLLDEYIPGPRTRSIFYVCGPFDYMLMVNISLRSNGIATGQIMKENFANLPLPPQQQPPDTAAHKVTIWKDDEKFELMVQYPQSITTAARKQGISLPYSCEAGRCGSCAATCIEGKIWMAYNEVLMDEEIAKGRVLTCTGYPIHGDAVIRY